jgi:hypothetical protein
MTGRIDRATLVTVLGAAGIVLAVAGGGWMAFDRLVRSDAAPAPVRSPAREPAPSPDLPLWAEVVSVKGEVQRRGPDGAWRGVVLGDRLQAEESIRTSRGSAAALAVGQRSRLAVAEGTQLTVRELTAAVHRLQLSRGHVAVDYQPDGRRVLRIENDGGGAVAETRGARFSVLSSGVALAVATETGAVTLTSAGRSEEVPAGAQSVAFAGAAPSPAAAPPIDLLLKVARGGDAGLPCSTVQGRATPGAEVEVDGEPAAVDRDGRFTARVTPREGRVLVSVVARDASGRVLEHKVGCAPVEPRIDDFAVKWSDDEGHP